MDFGFFIILVAVTGLGWWLSGFDSKVTGENRVADVKRRVIRCGATIVLTAIGIGAALSGGRFGGFVFIAMVVPLAIIWTGCVSEIFAHGFHRLVDSPDYGEYDPKELTRELDRLADLVKQGRNGEAIHLCAKLRESASVSALALDATLFHIYDEMFADHCLATSPTLAEAQKMRDEGHYLQAENRLNQLLKEEPRNLQAGVLLMQLYARNLRNSKKAYTLLHAFEQQTGIPAGFTDYVHQCIGEWIDPSTARKRSANGIESLLVEKRHLDAPEDPIAPPEATVPDLLKSGRLGTAIERLETSIKMRPHDFDLRLQLAEAYGRYCCNFSRARDIIARIEASPVFSPEQVRKAKAKLKDWQGRRPANQFTPW
jgi:hypothetical protein